MKKETQVLIGKGVLTLLAALVSFVAFYLLGVFINLSWNVATWGGGARFTVAYFGFFLGAGAGGVSGYFLYRRDQ